MDDNLRISDLWLADERRWDEIRVRQLFIAEDAEFLLKVRCQVDFEDSFIWGLATSGNYTTQTGYKLAKPLHEAIIFQGAGLSEIEKNLW